MNYAHKSMIFSKKKGNRFKVVALILTFTLLVNCGGRAANPIMVQQYGDKEKPCKALELEMSQMQTEIQRLVPKTDKTGKNVALGITGLLFIIPLFFMDLSQAEQIEVNALRQRNNHLVIIATDKNCGFNTEPIPEFDKKPTPQEL